MPYEWVTPLPADPTAPHPKGPLAEMHLWPYRSLPRRGFAAFLGITAALVFLPLAAVLGSAVLWGLLPFVVIAFGLTWYLIERSYKDGEILETLIIQNSEIHLLRQSAKAPDAEWRCNVYWAQVSLHPRGGPVPNYVTLKGNGREVEIGAFLSEEERKALYDELLLTLPRATHFY
ncbi:MAG: DUF2244 domain-containing protein [Pseudomonadota bacterium]|nr:DUF2244 domain-containing protein [Pseudomonadota bacterium]MEE3070066.1 DUF2244 domain-containing protein [Pseudomonadota bacterium]